MQKLYSHGLAKKLAASFALATLGGCATLNHTDTADCIERNGTTLSLPLLGTISSRSDRYSEACATARAATTIAGMRKKDGSPDLAMYNLASSLYEQSNPQVRNFMDKMLKENGSSMELIRFEISRASEPVACEKVVTKKTDGSVASGFKCTPSTTAVR